MSLRPWIVLAVLMASAAHAVPGWLDAFIQRVNREGHDAQLPPHLSLVLGLGDGTQAVRVKQLGTQSPEEIRTFNVPHESKGGAKRIVLLDYEQRTHRTYAFLVKRAGTLEKAVTYEAGAQPQLMADAEARQPFKRELEYWQGMSGK
jgi:hypothetical protein